MIDIGHARELRLVYENLSDENKITVNTCALKTAAHLHVLYSVLKSIASSSRIALNVGFRFYKVKLVRDSGPKPPIDIRGDLKHILVFFIGRNFVYH